MALDGRRREAGQVGHGQVVGVAVAERVDGRHPAGAEHQRDVVGVDAGQLGEALGGRFGRDVRVVEHRCVHNAGRYRFSRPMDRQGRARRSAT